MPKSYNISEVHIIRMNHKQP